MRRRVVLLGVVAALATACSGSEAGPTATVGTAAPTTATTDPHAIPAVIDIAYVNRVLAGLDKAVGDATRIVYSTHTIPREAYARLRALYGEDELLQLNIDFYQEDISRDFANYKDPPGDQKTTVRDLITAEPDCIFLEAHRDFSDIAVESDPALSRLWVVLKPLNRSRDPNNYNPTPWMYTYDGSQPDRSAPPNPCTA